jgi:hypothetical protein
MQITHRALRLRLYAFQASLRLLGQAVLPGNTNRPLSSLVDEYERTAETLLRLGRLRNEQHI